MVVGLDDDLWFPDPRDGEPDGLIAVGGDLSPERLCLAYHYGIFPWYSFRQSAEPYWYCPMERFVIFPSEIHVSHSMRTLINKGRYRCTFDNDFMGVITGCCLVENRFDHEYAWLGENIISAYAKLHHMHIAMSVETWEGEKLVGGLYGVVVNHCFIGESMFSLVPNASKLALIHLARFMQQKGKGIIDCQFETPHLKSMGGRFIDYDDYLRILHEK